MGFGTWQVSADVDPRKLGEARALAHNAVQWLARLGNSYRTTEPFNRHVSLIFDGQRQALITRPLAGDVAVELRLPRLEMQFREGERLVPHVLDIEGRSSAQIEAWVLVELLHRGIDRDRFSKHLPYDVHNLMAGDSVEYSPEGCAKELEALSSWVSNAQCVLGHLAQRHATNGIPPEVVCWPDPFQIGLVLAAEPGGQIGDRALRVGMSAGDERISEPYFFLAEETRGVLRSPPSDGVLTASVIAHDKSSAETIVAKLEAMIATTRKRMAT